MAIRILRSHIKGPWASGGNPLLATVDPTLTPTAKNGVTGTQTLVASDLNGIITNTGNTGVLILALPAAGAVGVDNTALKIQVTVASAVIVVPAAGEKIWLGGSGTASATLSIPGVVGNYVDIYFDGSQSMVVGYAGALTKSS